MSAPSAATIEDVARLAEVSIATVSRAIHTPEKVAKTTRLRVNEAIAVTGYTTNAMARSLRMGKSNMILIVAPDIGDPNFSNILVGLETEARQRGYGLLISHTQNDPERELEYLRFLNSNQAAGLILFTGHIPYGFNAGDGARLPSTVAVFEPFEHADIPYVGVDDRAGARKAVDHLLAIGHRRIAFIGDSKTKVGYIRRRQGYEDGLSALGVPLADRQVMSGDGSLESGRVAVEQLFMRDRLPTAFLCVNDMTAIGVILALTARGYDLPHDFSVIGFDDVPQAGFISPSLTTVAQPRTAIGKHAMTTLLSLLNGTKPKEREMLLVPDLTIRMSVTVPPTRPSRVSGTRY
ncbi:LacI family transcriptional regulator [Rhizobium sp. TRM95111]|uniref:LacI family DNA-binding transcriptional regulator n=1 Tax=Rhizobium alarense TaxID=2846851 RepID=UPI001F2AC574|nr:LacI family DNA-binding transcriptional regulator [Rhizobium alarense]MCF3643204.1 LacI family transcriptional regulator [Rhizobium alarense]